MMQARSIDPSYHREEARRWREVQAQVDLAVPNPPMPATRLGALVAWVLSPFGLGAWAQIRRADKARAEIAAGLYQRFLSDRGYAVVRGEINAAEEWFAEGFQHTLETKRELLLVPSSLTDPDIAGTVLVASLLRRVRNREEVLLAARRLAERLDTPAPSEWARPHLVKADNDESRS